MREEGARGGEGRHERERERERNPPRKKRERSRDRGKEVEAGRQADRQPWAKEDEEVMLM